MKTISFISNKGGTGKTTAAVNIAVMATNNNYKVLIGDLDPQKSCLDWARERKKDGPSVITIKRGALFNAQLSAEREGIDLLILDTPSASPEISLQAAKGSNLTVMVTRPTVMDLRTMTDMVTTLKSLGLRSVILLNQAPSQRNSKEPVLVKEAIGYLLGFGLPLVPSCIRTRMAFQASITSGNSASELFPDGVAAHEVNAVWTYLSGQLSLNPSRQITTGL